MLNIRRNLFWLMDAVEMAAVFIATGRLAPFLQAQLLPGGHFYASWLEMLSLEDAHASPYPLRQFLWVLVFIVPATIICFEFLGGYSPVGSQRPARIIFASVLGPFTGVALMSTTIFVLKGPAYSRLFVITFAILSSMAIATSRMLGRSWYNYTLREGMHKKELALLGEVEGIKLVAGLLEKELSHCLVGYFATGGDPQPVRLDRGGTLQPLGCIADLKQVLISKAIQAVLMVLPPGEAPWLEEAVRACDYFRVAAHIVPQVVLTARLDDLVSETSGLSGKVPTLSLVPGEAHDDWLFVKRVMDVCIGGLLLVLLSPIFLLIAIAIKLTTPHLPVFYPWRVVGNRGRRFTGYKFTTMVADADAQRESLASLNEMTGPVFKIAKDPRITPLGKFLRRFSLNELPQLWSVFKGDMSLVGPRPAGPHELERYELWQKRKLSAQPGITCFWQVQGRNRISSFDDWVRLDLEYIQRRSLWLDCTILAKTFWVVIRGTGS